MLAQQLTPDHHGRQRDYWCTPGGGLEETESLIDGLSREMVEETGITPTVGRLLFIQQFDDGENEQLEFFFNIENVNDYDHIDLTSTSHGLAEIKNVAFVDPKTVWLLPEFLQTIDIASYIERSRDVLIINNLRKTN